MCVFFFPHTIGAVDMYNTDRLVGSDYDNVLYRTVLYCTAIAQCTIISKDQP